MEKSKIPKNKALKLIDQKIAQFQKKLENVVWDNRYDEDYDIAYHGTETLLKELFSEEEAKDFSRNVLTGGVFFFDEPLDVTKELREYKEHIGKCITQLKIYRERVDNFYPDEHGVGEEESKEVVPPAKKVNFKRLATKLGQGLINQSTLKNTGRVASSIFDFEVQSHPNPNFTSSNALLIYNWVMTLSEQPIDEETKLDLLNQFIQELAPKDSPIRNLLAEELGVTLDSPIDITESLARFNKDHPDPQKVAFIMMRFSDTKAHQGILNVIKNTLKTYGIEGVRSDDKEYHEDLLPNVKTYLHGCGFGIAVFERIETESFNPNVSLEVGYMLAFGKQVCYLKDKTLQTLHADIIGKLYKEFDPHDPEGTIPSQVTKWLEDKEIIG